MMKREIFITDDGSHSIRSGELTYHSRHGAIQESRHVFIESGLNHWLALNDIKQDQPIRIFEMGFGTGLNALLTYIEATDRKISVHYTTVELNPLSGVEARHLNYPGQLNRPELDPYFHEMHDAAWETNSIINPYFTLQKMRKPLEELQLPDERSMDAESEALIDLVYFDAFAPTAQPELWTENIFRKIAGWMNTGGILVTYCSKGDVKRAMLAAGFSVEKIAGPPFKREMLRAKVEL